MVQVFWQQAVQGLAVLAVETLGPRTRGGPTQSFIHRATVVQVSMQVLLRDEGTVTALGKKAPTRPNEGRLVHLC